MKAGWRKWHLWLSLPFGLVLTLVCWTGAALVFEQEITEALNRPLYHVEYQEGDTVLAPSVLAEKIRQQTGDSLHLTSLRFSGDKEKICWAYFAETSHRSLLVDPYTGAVKGWNPKYPFFQVMLKMHRWLLDSPPQKGTRTLGKTIVGISVLAMVLILISGVIIGWPRHRSMWKQRLQIACHQGQRRFWHDCHVTLGFCAVLFLCLMAMTGLNWSFGWYQEAAYRLFGVKQQRAAVETSAPLPSTSTEKTKTAFDYTLWDRAWQELHGHYASYTTITLKANTAEVAHGLLGKQTDRWLIATQPSGETSLTPNLKPERSKQVRSGFYAVHTGSWGGWITKILYFLAALIGGMLSLSGYYLWWTRIRKQHHPVSVPHRTE